MEITTTDYVAGWGALTGSLVLLWDIIKWSRTGAKLKIEVRPNTFYEDGEVLKVEKNEHGEITTYAHYYHIEVVNVGNQPTTILSIEATTKPLGLENIKKKHVGFVGYLLINFTSIFDGEDGRSHIPTISEFTKVLNRARLAGYWKANSSAILALNLTEMEKEVVTGNYTASYKSDLGEVYKVLDELMTEVRREATSKVGKA